MAQRGAAESKESKSISLEELPDNQYILSVNCLANGYQLIRHSASEALLCKDYKTVIQKFDGLGSTYYDEETYEIVALSNKLVHVRAIYVGRDNRTNDMVKLTQTLLETDTPYQDPYVLPAHNGRYLQTLALSNSKFDVLVLMGTDTQLNLFYVAIAQRYHVKYSLLKNPHLHYGRIFFAEPHFLLMTEKSRHEEKATLRCVSVSSTRLSQGNLSLNDFPSCPVGNSWDMWIHAWPGCRTIVRKGQDDKTGCFVPDWKTTTLTEKPLPSFPRECKSPEIAGIYGEYLVAYEQSDTDARIYISSEYDSEFQLLTTMPLKNSQPDLVFFYEPEKSQLGMIETPKPSKEFFPSSLRLMDLPPLSLTLVMSQVMAQTPLITPLALEVAGYLGCNMFTEKSKIEKTTEAKFAQNALRASILEEVNEGLTILSARLEALRCSDDEDQRKFGDFIFQFLNSLKTFLENPNLSIQECLKEVMRLELPSANEETVAELKKFTKQFTDRLTMGEESKAEVSKTAGPGAGQL